MEDAMRNGWAMIVTMALAGGPALAEDEAAGKETYLRYCATCHGTEGRGDGPTAAILTLQPTDLTQLAARAGGVLPIGRIVARIDGREPMVAHGSPMPVWGEFFDGQYAAIKTAAGQPILTSQPIVDLVAYIDSIQN
jgi:mono/diheme cytochrome c family protein